MKTFARYRITGRDAKNDLMKSFTTSRKKAEEIARYWRVQYNFTKVKIRGINEVIR
ncbi:MAG: hypothetical protein Sv326_1341 (plasmid) [Candidatus Fermentimicrarchaeum limneticum]|uniref:Uncharacterized protein n=1 Tax=Fermentimicrarchaeum limneticum TaxID=2795018 RepID=A0A7D6BMA3_FERL1|nr:MAG: hypothetical protein Sv326_1341 [Candidatus Fermentimicrarchaeum limneticum]